MDRKTVIILLVSVLVLLAWGRLTNYLYPPRPIATNTVSSVSVTNQIPAMPGTSSPPILSAADATNLIDAAKSLPTATNLPPAEEQTVVLEDEDARYTFTSHGGGIKLIELKNYPEVVGCNGSSATNRPAGLNRKAPLPVFAIIDEETLAAPSPYELTRSGNTVRAEAELAGGIRVIKEFQLSTNYLVKAKVRYENRSAQPGRLPQRELVVGTANPMGRGDDSRTVVMEWYNGDKTEAVPDSWFANKGMVFDGTPRPFYTGGESNLVWAAANNRFFTLVTVPESIGWRVIGRRVNLPPPTTREQEDNPGAERNPHGIQTAILLPSTTLAPNHFLEQSYDIYAGPKEYKTLSRLPKNMDLVMGFGRWFGFFAKALLLSMNGIYALAVPYGLAIIVITVIIKLLFWPLTTASTRSMKRMSALQPQMKALQEKYKDDPKKMNMKLMEFMKENKVSPLGGCLPLLLQIPVFIGFYQMLQSAIELRGARFLWACDLSQPDTVFWIGSFPVNILPLLMAGTMLWQARITPMSPGMDPMQQQIMKYMPLMMVAFLYNFSAGLTLYWTVQNLLSIAQMKLTRASDAKGASAKAPAPAKPVQPPKKKK